MKVVVFWRFGDFTIWRFGDLRIWRYEEFQGFGCLEEGD